MPGPVEVVVVYREILSLGRSEADLANDIVAMTPPGERRQMAGFWLGSPSIDQNKKRGLNTVADQIGDIFRRNGLPRPTPADDHRVDGWRFM